MFGSHAGVTGTRFSLDWQILGPTRWYRQIPLVRTSGSSRKRSQSASGTCIGDYQWRSQNCLARASETNAFGHLDHPWDAEVKPLGSSQAHMWPARNMDLALRALSGGSVTCRVASMAIVFLSKAVVRLEGIGAPFDKTDW